MRDIEAATGEDLGSDRVGKKGKKGKKKKHPNLSDLKQSANTSRSRLERKVFNKYVSFLQDIQSFSPNSETLDPTIPIMHLSSIFY